MQKGESGQPSTGSPRPDDWGANSRAARTLPAHVSWVTHAQTLPPPLGPKSSDAGCPPEQ